ncbi:MAG: glycosyltransferase [Tepidimonas sp.]|uniref:MraY family glycosyltransferase n=1 Tax=Tepidimonas sp. TaxID=2002775 RepID=UPI00259E18B7|nr:glycosyltransferase [Tepidimonas sp.]MDM7457074.1 glycosyltransferase [Tepidimonas sp.]
MQTILLAFFSSLLACLLIVRLQRLHLNYTGDLHDQTRQKYHAGTVPRIGGVALLSAAALALSWSSWRGIVSRDVWYLMVAALPAFGAGCVEDLTKQISPRVRLMATFASAALAAWWLQSYVTAIGIPVVDDWLAWTPLDGAMIAPAGLLLTIVGVAGVANAINIIDGFHGLSAAVSILMFLALGYVGWVVGDALTVQVSLAMIGALVGFMFWNYPRGLIFMGDGGAYLTGFLLAQTGVLLATRNPQVSPWFVLLVCAYPIIETLFSMYRKFFIRKISPTLPDALHMHILIYRRLLRWAAGPEVSRDVTPRNAATSPYLWMFSSLSIAPAVLLWNQPTLLQLVFLAYVAFYLWFYRRLVRFRAPRWLRRSITLEADQSSHSR